MSKKKKSIKPGDHLNLEIFVINCLEAIHGKGCWSAEARKKIEAKKRKLKKGLDK